MGNMKNQESQKSSTGEEIWYTRGSENDREMILDHFGSILIFWPLLRPRGWCQNIPKHPYFWGKNIIFDPRTLLNMSGRCPKSASHMTITCVILSYDIIWYHMISYAIIWYHMLSYDNTCYHRKLEIETRSRIF